MTIYRVERCTGAGCTTFSEIGTTAGLTFSDPGRTASTTYRYQVRAGDAAGNLGPYTAIATATTPAASDTVAPSAPGAVTATAVGSTQVNLSWGAATDNVAVTIYRVERCTGAGCTTFSEIGTATGLTYGDTGLSASTTYRYQVRAGDAAGNLGPYTAIATATTGTVGPPPSGLMAAYAFDEGAGTTVSDASGNGNTGTIAGATWTTQGRNGGALTFNGTSNLVAIPSSASLTVTTGMTLEGWVYPTAAQSGWRTIMQKEADAYFLNASTDAGPLFPGGGGTIGGTSRILRAPAANPVNAWTHVAVTYSGTTLTLYVNGISVATQAATGTIQTSTTPLRIGGNVPYGEYFQGRIDDVRVYNRALTAAEVQTDMTTPVGGTAPGDTVAPSAPGAVTATAGSATQVDLSWGAATDNVAVTIYRVERCTGAGCTTFS